MEPSTQRPSSVIPIAIIIGFALIALAIYLTGNQAEQRVVQVTPEQADQGNVEGVARPVNETDYILGNPNAPIMMIEYSDYECPFCKQFHATMHQIMDEYGVTGQLGWVYRQFPLGQLHPNAPLLSKAALCVGKLGGNTAFWDFSDRVFEEREIDAFTNVTKLPEFAEKAGVSKEEYTACVTSSEMDATVEQSIRDGFNSGARSTPYTVLIVGDQQAVINGAQSYDVIKGIVSNLIEQLKGNVSTQSEPPEVPTNASGIPVLE